eukprot:Sdes_comp16061_c0_seq1m5269
MVCVEKKKKKKKGNTKEEKNALSEFARLKKSGNLRGWKCCNIEFDTICEIYHHCNVHHSKEIQSFSEKFHEENKTEKDEINSSLEKHAIFEAQFDWQQLLIESQDLITPILNFLHPDENPSFQFIVILFYKYAPIYDSEEFTAWQHFLCEKLFLKGKIRVGAEGVNITLSGLVHNMNIYVKIMTKLYDKVHWSGNIQKSIDSLNFRLQDFKFSRSEKAAFSELSARQVKEIITLGIKFDSVFPQGGVLLPPREFHEALQEKSFEDVILVDLRNFYEWKIGRFDLPQKNCRMVLPNIRKFSYFPEYVDKNLHLFSQKQVFMYCTGGVRCERGSEYLKCKGVCKEIYQLEGGIHKYLEEYGNRGFFKGSLYVFDERQALTPTSLISKRKKYPFEEGEPDDIVLSKCFFCSSPWENYTKCARPKCELLIMACENCINNGHIYCCDVCPSITLQSSLSSSPSPSCICISSRNRVNIEIQ